MSIQSITHKRQLLASLAVCALTFYSKAALADSLVGQKGEVHPGSTPETWNLSAGSILDVFPGASTLGIVVQESTVTMQGASAQDAQALQLRNGSIARISAGSSLVSTSGAAIQTSNTSGGGAGARSFVTLDNSSATGTTAGVALAGHAQFSASGSAIRATAANGIGVSVFSADVTLSAGTTVSGQQNGIRLQRDDRGEDLLPTVRNVTIDNSVVTGITGSGILVNTLSTRSGITDGTINLRNGAEVSGGNGTAIELAERTTVAIDSDASRILGDVTVADGSNTTLALRNGSTLQGATRGDISTTIDASTWNVTGDSSVTSLAMNGGQIAFAPRGDTHSTLSVANNFAGNGGLITMNVNVDAVGPVSGQATDRLLIGGDVTGTTYLDIVPTGKGTSTDRNGNAIIDPSEGILLVGVGGNAASDSFKLARPLTVGGFDYELLARNGSEIDPSRNPFPSGPLNWEYSLVTPTCTRDGCTPVEPEPPVEPKPPVDPEPPVKPPVERPKLAEQVPSYLLTGAAIQNYNSLFGGWRQREGNVADGSADASSGGYAFARYVGGQYDYSSNRSFQNYGFDAHWLMNAFQVGGGLFDWAGNRGTLRAGWALDHGTLRISPHAVDGDSSTRFTANGIGMWLNWQGDNGLWVDGVLTGRRFTGDVGTDTQGKDVARIHASSWVASVEVGKTFMAGDWAIEPHTQLTRQQVSFRDFRDQDGLDVSLGSGTQTSARVGVLVRRAIDEKFIPYVRTDFTYTVSGTPTATLSSEDWNVSNTFGTGRTGHSVLVAAGATSQLARNVQLYGEGNYQHQLGGYGVRGWSGNIGVRVSF